MIYCCGGYHNPLRTVFLASNAEYKDRKLEILICPNCGYLVAVLTQFNIKKQKYESFRPKRKKTAKFIQSFESSEWKNIRIKYGTKGNRGFIYGVNKELKNGKICQYAVDFNGIKKLVKVID